jgi:hypothetical protein
VGLHRYRIIVSGRLGQISREAFEDLSVESDGANTGLTGELDQAALHGVLNRILALGLELVALSRPDDGPSRDQGACDVPRILGFSPDPAGPGGDGQARSARRT